MEVDNSDLHNLELKIECLGDCKVEEMCSKGIQHVKVSSAEIKKYWNCPAVILKDSYMYNSYTTAMKKRACKNERERDSGRKIVQGKDELKL